MADPAAPAIRLRPWRTEDAAALAAAWNDPDIAAGSEPPPDRSVAAAEGWIEGCGIREQRPLAIDRVIDVDGVCVGEVGLSNLDQRRGAALIGWWTAEEHRGNGYASAGVAEMAALAFAEFGLTALVAEIGVDNAASVRVAERTGFEVLREGSPDHPHAYVRRRGGG